MLMFIILFAFITIAQSSDFSAYFGKTTSVAFFPKIKHDHAAEMCLKYNVSLVDVKCTCGDNAESINANPLAFQGENSTAPDMVLAISIVNTESEALEVLTKYKTCKCGENVYVHQAYRPINAKFYLQYLKNPYDEKEPLGVILLSRYEETKTDVENIIQSIDELKTREFSLVCQYASN